MITFPSGKGKRIIKRSADGTIMKCRVKDKRHKRKRITRSDDFEGVGFEDIYLQIEVSIQKLTKEQQAYIRPYILPPISIYTSDPNLREPPAKTLLGRNADYPRFRTLKHYLVYAGLLKGSPIDKDHSYFTVLSIQSFMGRGHVEAIRFNPVRKIFSVYITTPEQSPEDDDYITQQRYITILKKFLDDPEYELKMKYMDQQEGGDIGCGLYAASNLMAAIKKKPRVPQHSVRRIKRVKRMAPIWRSKDPPYPNMTVRTQEDVEEYNRQMHEVAKTNRITRRPWYSLNGSFDMNPFKIRNTIRPY
jgi:hypothetical protein